MICKRCYVSGRVQGVFFRAKTLEMAQQLNLSGHARNLADGRVEVLACGEQESVEQLCKWLWQGPPMAQVSEVVCQESNSPAPATFSMG